MENKEQQKRPIEQLVRVNKKGEVKSFINSSKRSLKKFGDITISALGEATTNAVQVAAKLEKYELASITKIDIGPDDEDKSENNRRKQKLTINLKKSAKFDELTKDLVLNE